jgi:hypothetical protein
VAAIITVATCTVGHRGFNKLLHQNHHRFHCVHRVFHFAIVCLNLFGDVGAERFVSRLVVRINAYSANSGAEFVFKLGADFVLQGGEVILCQDRESVVRR